MSKKSFVGVVNTFVVVGETGMNITPLKQLALIFDQLFMTDIVKLLPNKEFNELTPEAVADLRWLIEKGIVLEKKSAEDVEIQNPEYEALRNSSVYEAKKLVNLLFDLDIDEIVDAKKDKAKWNQVKKKINALRKLKPEDIKKRVETNELKESVITANMILTRVLSIEMRELENLDAIPILPIQINTGKTTNKNEVVQIVINSLPAPSDTTSWEQILEFRNDPDSRSKFLALRNWMNEIAKGTLTPIEVEQKLEFLLDQYQQHMKLHRMKTNAGAFQSFITTGAEFLGDLVSFKWGKGAEALFTLRNRKIALLEGELKAPGNEVAYIIKAQESLKK